MKDEIQKFKAKLTDFNKTKDLNEHLQELKNILDEFPFITEFLYRFIPLKEHLIFYTAYVMDKKIGDDVTMEEIERSLATGFPELSYSIFQQSYELGYQTALEDEQAINRDLLTITKHKPKGEK